MIHFGNTKWEYFEATDSVIPKVFPKDPNYIKNKSHNYIKNKLIVTLQLSSYNIKFK